MKRLAIIGQFVFSFIILKIGQKIDLFVLKKNYLIQYLNNCYNEISLLPIKKQFSKK